MGVEAGFGVPVIRGTNGFRGVFAGAVVEDELVVEDGIDIEDGVVDVKGGSESEGGSGSESGSESEPSREGSVVLPSREGSVVGSASPGESFVDEDVSSTDTADLVAAGLWPPGGDGVEGVGSGGSE